MAALASRATLDTIVEAELELFESRQHAEEVP
jgi:hypothetical protein